MHSPDYVTKESMRVLSPMERNGSALFAPTKSMPRAYQLGALAVVLCMLLHAMVGSTSLPVYPALQPASTCAATGRSSSVYSDGSRFACSRPHSSKLICPCFTMHIAIHLASPQDASDLFTVAALAFGDDEPAWAAYFQGHGTMEGRKLGAERFLESMAGGEHTVWHKAVDTETGKLVGFSIWTIYQHRFITLPIVQPADSYWHTAEDAEYAKSIMSYIMQQRHDYVKSFDGNAVHLNTLAVLPAYQRMGIGSKLMDWGLGKADELGFDAWVEASIPGRPLYEKRGFIFQRDVTIVVPSKFSDRGKKTFASLTRPASIVEAVKGTAFGSSADVAVP